MDGLGTLYHSRDGREAEQGEWVNSKKQGKFIQTDAFGRKTTATYENGERVSA